MRTLAGIVTLVDFSQRPDQLLRRLIVLGEVLKGTEFSLTIGHADRNTSADIALKALFKQGSLASARLASISPEGANVELARLRNAAVALVHEDIVLMIDVDIYPDLRIFRSLVSKVTPEQRISIAPCIYLSLAGTKVIAREGGDKKIIESALCFSPELVLHWAMPSSVMAFMRKDCWAIGGFFEGYSGHGYEDFDFMLRLAVYAKMVSPSLDILRDETYRAPMLATGFRSELAILCLPNLLEGCIAFHQFHKKDHNSSYQKRRSINSKIFQNRVLQLVQDKENISTNDPVPNLIKVFFAECKRRGVDPLRFYALFDARPRYLLSRPPFLMRVISALRRDL